MSEATRAKHRQPLFEQLTLAQRRWILFAVAVGTFMGPLDSSVVNIALPSISAFYNVTLSTVEWVVMSYLLVISSLLLTYGRMGDLYGHRKIYISGFAIFTIGSLLCAVSPTIAWLIIFRALQAIGAGMMMSMGPAIITDITPPRERGKSLGVVAVSVSVALTAGPVLGGFLTNTFGWESVFLINIPIGILAIILALKVIPPTGGDEAQPFDIAGSTLLFLALISILYSLSNGQSMGWTNPLVIGLLAAGIVIMISFLFLENKVKYPMLDLSLFKNKLYSMGNTSAMISYIAMFSVVLIMPFYLQDLLGYSPSKAGFFMIPMPLVTMIIAPIAGTVSDRVDTRYVSSLGLAINALALWLLANLDPSSSIISITLALAVMGLGSGLFQTPNNSAVLGTVPPYRRGIASSMLAIMRNIGMVLGVAISGAIFSSRLDHLKESLAASGLAGTALQHQAFTGALHTTFIVAAAIAVIGVFASLVRGPLHEANKITD
ncbi:MFS transporter [Metallumcola ferriviriculae]|uniref:MFS transporter n=1 Tax=Metallumcola ferriviriculae TaxID=3039180 RepID=A0AAU0UT86_9FIRM|nr:MFS transporter [Desulfitibacteraceae bacterium MK1]